MNTIAVDAMGGDSAPEEIVKGAIKAKNLGIDVILSGDKNLIEPFLNNTKIPIVHYPEVISMDENPARAIRSKKNSSIVMITHAAKNSSFVKILSILKKKNYIIKKPKIIRIENI